MYNKELAVTAASFRAGEKGIWFKWATQREDDGSVTVWRKRADCQVWDFTGICDSWEQAQNIARCCADHSRQLLHERGVAVKF